MLPCCWVLVYHSPITATERAAVVPRINTDYVWCGKIARRNSRLACDVRAAGVNRQIRDVITTGIDMCGRRMRKGGGGWTIHPSRRWLISCARTAVLCVCLSIALTSCTTSIAETNLDAIRKQKNAKYSKRYRLKRKMKMQQQAPTTSEAEPEKLQV